MSSEQASALATHPLPDTALRHLREFLLMAAKDPSTKDGEGMSHSTRSGLGNVVRVER